MYLKKIWKKITNKKDYKELKEIEKINKSSNEFKSKYEPIINEIQKKIETKKEISFKHSGHSGDIINALPVIKKLSKTHKCNLFINTNKPLNTIYKKHPADKVFVNDKIFTMLTPLLKSQTYISKVEKFKSQDIDVDFDIFRNFPINISFDNLRYSFQITGIQPDIEKPYLTTGIHKEIKNKIIIQRTFRYRNQFINYKFLNSYKDIFFVGTVSEYEDLKREVKNLNYYECKDFLEMAEIINSSKFFIGNSSVGFPIAEALKVPRLLESCPYFPAAQPHGKDAYDFYYQIHFEKFFKILNDK